MWLYHDPELRSDVAVKALADNWAQRLDIRDRFLEEARLLRQADSDHVVRVYDIGESGGTPYFVMTYADRGSIANRLREGVPMAPAEAVGLVWQAGEGLAVLHGHGIVHRDIKPQNLLLRGDAQGRDRVLVADLGVAKAMLHASGLTQVVGTPSYMAPEQATGHAIDRRADVHALGAVAYRLLTGQVARDGSIGSLARAGLPPRPSTIAELPADVDEVLLRALEPDPDLRWNDVSSFLSALREAVPGVVVPSSSIEPITLIAQRTPDDADPSPRTGLGWWVLACVVVFVAAFVASYLLGGR